MTRIPAHTSGPQPEVWVVYEHHDLGVWSVYHSEAETEARDMLENLKRDNPRKRFFLRNYPALGPA